ncbi:MAG: sulfatase [Candidatus Solibacter usitatus]|nr:sulfatase [Candidatus Solibacter usitatus]
MQRRNFIASTATGAMVSSQIALTQNQPQAKWNILVLVSDTTRKGFLEPYGNKTVKTPSLARLAAESAVFDNARPECLPTIPTRRTLHSGRRVFPFRNYQPVPWDNVTMPGWQPMSPSEDTVAEALSRAGYHTGFYADVPHYTVPGMNFTRGFQQWDYIRGNAEDRYRSAAPYDKKRLSERYASGRAPAHVANLGGFEPDEMDFATPRTFSAAMKFLDENRTNPQPFYLYVDTFHPHETWEAPRKYYDLYRDPAYKGKTYLTLPYNTLAAMPVPEDAIQNARAHYSGLITMVDTWIGRLLAKLKETGKDENTLILYVSDHGTNFADNPERVMGKPSGAMYPGTMDVPLMVRHPHRKGAGKRFREFVYTLDIPATVCAAAGAAPREGVDGKNLLALMDGGGFAPRDYQTCRYAGSVFCTDGKSWFFSNIHWENMRLFDLESSNPFAKNVASQAGERVALAKKRILEDAGGALPVYPLIAADRVKGMI